MDFEPFGGTMPEDWKVGTFSEIIDDTIGGDWGKDEAQNNYTEEVYCIRGADIPDVKIGNKGKMPKRYILTKNYSSKKLRAGDLVIEISGGSPTQSTGRIAAISDYLLSRYDNKIICTNFCRALKPKLDYSEYIYHYWQYLYNKNVFFSYENGTTGIKNLDISGFLETEQISIPNQVVLKKFSELCDKFFKQIYFNGAENERLSALRDALLPKLMSGEIDVSNVDISALTSTDKLSFRCRSPPKNISYRFSRYFPLGSIICDIFIRQLWNFFAYFCIFSALFTGYNFISKHSLCCVNQIERIRK